MDDAQHRKPKGSGDKYIKLKVIGPDSNEIVFRVKTNTNDKLGKMKTTFEQKTGSTDTVFRYLYDGKRVQDDDTPEKLNMEKEKEENLVIEVHLQKFGGSSSTIKK